MTSIFLLEDNDDLARSVTAAIEGSIPGASVVWAMSVDEAMALYFPPYDVLLVDYELPDGTGVDFLNQIDRRGAFTILWSGLSRVEEARDLKEPADLLASKTFSAIWSIVEAATTPATREEGQ